MLMNAFIISIQIIAVHLCFKQGEIFGEVRIATANLLDWLFGKSMSIYIQKPMWNCVVCMASIWTIILSWSFDIHLILLVCGINYFLDKFIPVDDMPVD